MGDARYSFSLTTFSPKGKLVQIEHALQAANSGATSIGIKAKNGIVIATEKKLPPLVEPASVEKISEVSRSVGMLYSGMGPDNRVLAKNARKAAQQYYRTYLDEMPVNALVREVASVMQEFTQSGGVRPFGVSLLVAGVDARGPQLFQIDPSGSYFAWKASAIGKGKVNAIATLEKRYNDDVELEDAINIAIRTLKEGFEGELTEHCLEVGIINADDDEPTFRRLTPAQIKDYLSELD